MVQVVQKSVFEQQMVKIFGDETALIRLKLLGSDPWTERVSSRAYEQLLLMTHDAIRHHLGRENWRDRLMPFSGPQCHEDRGKKELYEYNPDMRLKSLDQNPIHAMPNNLGQVERETTTPLIPTNVVEDNAESDEKCEDILTIVHLGFAKSVKRQES